MTGALGYRGNRTWRDMSDYVVHFTRDTDQGSAYDNMLSILSQGVLRASNRFGAARKFDALADSQRSVCFSEIPLDLLDRLVERRDSQYGIGFHQEALISAGGGRVWYVAKGSQAQRSVERIIGSALHPFDREHPIWRLAPFIDFPGTYGDVTYHFEWEREWRVPANLEFAPEEVSFLFIPQEMHSAARWFFEEAEREQTGPSYDCPILDPLWDDDLIQRALEGL